MINGISLGRECSRLGGNPPDQPCAFTGRQQCAFYGCHVAGDETAGSDTLWLALASASTLAEMQPSSGPANLIVIESAEREGIRIRFIEFMKSGLIHHHPDTGTVVWDTVSEIYRFRDEGINRIKIKDKRKKIKEFRNLGM
jgi:hypothetical protein